MFVYLFWIHLSNVIFSVQPEPQPSGAPHLLDVGCGWNLPDVGPVWRQPGPGPKIPQFSH